MDYAAHAAAAAAPPAADPRATYPSGYPYAYAYPPYHYPDPAAVAPSVPAPAPAASSSYYYSNPAAPASTGAQYNPYTGQYHYYGAPATDGGGGLADYYFTAGEASQAPTAQTAPAASAAAAAGREAVKQFGFDPQRYAQVAAAKAPNGVAPTAAATVMHHAQWNAHFGHPLPTNVRRSFRKKAPKVVQPITCEVCKIQCDTMDVLLIHKTGQKHKKNLQKLQDAITPQPAKPPNGGVAANTAPPAAAAAAAADGVMPAVKPKKNKSSNASPGDLEVKKRRVIEAGAAHGEMKICTACNVVVNSQKVYEFHLAGHKHKANVLKQEKQQQAQQQQQQAQQQQQQQQQQVQLQHVA